jgi:hypothetical protein
MEGLLLALEQSGFAAAMRSSVFLFPVANVVHILAALVFFAAVAAMDVRVFTAADVGEARRFVDRVRPVAVVAFLFQVASGVMLLAPEATHIWHNPVFRLKLVAIAIGLANVILLEVLIRRPGRETLSGGIRAAAGLSLGAWLTTAALGRLIAYF